MTSDDDAFEGSMAADADADADADEACALTPEEGANDATRCVAVVVFFERDDDDDEERNGRGWGARDRSERRHRSSPRDAWTACTVVV